MSFSYNALSLEIVPCPVCHMEKFAHLASHDRYGMGIVTVRCTNCGLIMTNPRPTSEALSDFYKNHYRYYYRKVRVPTLAHIKEYGLDERASYVTDYLERQGLLNSSVGVLDAGCGEGSILREIRRRYPGVNVVGIEPGIDFRKFAQDYAGCTILRSIEELREKTRENFSLVIIHHVLEHVTHPVQFLRGIAEFVREEGSIYVDVPDAGAYSSIDDLHIAHLYHFSPRTLVRTAHEASLKVAQMERHAPPRLPRSIRCVLIFECQEVINFPTEDDNAIFHKVKIINFYEYGRRRSLLIRLAVGLVKRLRRIVGYCVL